MIKKRHIVEIVSVAVIAFLIGTMLNVNLLTMAGKEEEDDGPPTWQVYVTGVNASAYPDTWTVNIANFPLDEEGNLKVSIQNRTSGIYRDTIRTLLFDQHQPVTLRLRENLRKETSSYFAFSPKTTFINLTSVCVNVLIRSDDPDSGDYTVGFSFNGGSEQYFTKTVGKLSVQKTFNISDAEVYGNIRNGLNGLSVSLMGGSPDIHSVFIYRLDLLIEYKYQAR